MSRRFSHTSPFSSMRAKAPSNCTWPARSDFTSAPDSMMPASIFSTISKSWRARRFSCTSLTSDRRAAAAAAFSASGSGIGGLALTRELWGLQPRDDLRGAAVHHHEAARRARFFRADRIDHLFLQPEGGVVAAEEL